MANRVLNMHLRLPRHGGRFANHLVCRMYTFYNFLTRISPLFLYSPTLYTVLSQGQLRRKGMWACVLSGLKGSGL